MTWHKSGFAGMGPWGNSAYVLQGVDVARETMVSALVQEHFRTVYRYIAFLEQTQNSFMNNLLAVMVLGKAVRQVERGTRKRFAGQTTVRAWLLSFLYAHNKVGIPAAVLYLKSQENFEISEIAFALGISERWVLRELAENKAPDRKIPGTPLIRPAHSTVEAQVNAWLSERASLDLLHRRDTSPEMAVAVGIATLMLLITFLLRLSNRF